MKESWTKNSHEILEQASGLENYNRWIISLFEKYLGKNILEVGSGLGGISAYLPKSETTLSDVQDGYFNYLKNHFDNKTLKLDIEKDIPESLMNSFDTIISSNVLEHIKEDSSALNNFNKLLKKEGDLLLFVPARPELLGSLDRSMGHFRRYTITDLSEKVTKAGFNINKIKYVNFPGFFTWWLRGRLPGKSAQDDSFAKIFDNLVVPFLYLEKYFPAPIGQSLMVVAEKK